MSLPLRCLPLIALLLSGCGAEVVGGVATVGTLQAGQLEQAREHQRQIEKKLGEGLQAGEDRNAAADR